jgi:hypothetical protein
MMINNKNSFMKNLLIAVCLVWLASCTETNTNAVQLERDEHSQAIRKPLSLNNGEKWMLDKSTRENAAEIKSILNKANERNLDSVAIPLRSKTDELVRECRMEGVAHETLHSWLENFIEDQKLVNNNEIPSAKLLEFLRKDVKELETYFR